MTTPASSPPTEMPARQILVDVSVIVRHDAQTGIQRVVRALLAALLNANLDGYVVRPVHATRDDVYSYVPWDAPLFAGLRANGCTDGAGTAVGATMSYAVGVRAGDIFLALDLASHILTRHIRQVTRWRKQGCRIVTVMYDLLPEQRPDWFNPKARRNYRRWLRVVTRGSDQIICISPEIADQLKAWVTARPWRGNTRLRYDHIRLGSDISRSSPSRGMPLDAADLLTSFAQRRTLLVVGTIEPRKGHACLLPAFDLLWREAAQRDVSLVFVGRSGWRTRELQARIRSHPETRAEAGAYPRFFWFDDASDEFLDCLYDVAHGVIVPSLGEGFGLPLVEALGHGVPVLARDLPVFKSMNLAKVSYFSQDDPHSLAISIREWLVGGGAGTSSGENSAPTWRNSFDDLLNCLSVSQSISSESGHSSSEVPKEI